MRFYFLVDVDHGNYDVIGKMVHSYQNLSMNKLLVYSLMSLPEVKCNNYGFPQEIIVQEKTRKVGANEL